MRSRGHATGRRWLSILLLTGLGVGLAALLVTAVTPQYQASADVLVQRLGAETATATPGERVVESYAAVIEGRGLTKPTADELDLSLDGDVEVAPRGDSDVLRITVTQPDPQDAVAAADDLAERFVRWLESEQPAEGSRVTGGVVAAAYASGDASSPNLGLWLAVGGVLGALGGVLLSLARSSGPRVVESGGLAKDVTGAPLLASIGHDPDARTSPLITQVEGQHPRHEAMRILRTNLQFLDVDRPHQVVTVTSALPGEGKTTTTCNLALAIAETGRSVVIVEGDLRQPRLAEIFGLERSVGVTTVLVGRVDLDAAIQPTTFGGLDVMTSGTLPPNPTEILQTEAMVTLVAELCRRYDMVLIDAPPVLPVADTQVLLDHELVDAAIVVGRAYHTTRDEIRRCRSVLSRHRQRNLGLVVNGLKELDSGYEYYGSAEEVPGGRLTQA